MLGDAVYNEHPRTNYQPPPDLPRRSRDVCCSRPSPSMEPRCPDDSAPFSWFRWRSPPAPPPPRRRRRPGRGPRPASRSRPSGPSRCPRPTYSAPDRVARARGTGSSAPTIASRRPSIRRRQELRGRETIHYVNRSARTPCPTSGSSWSRTSAGRRSITEKLDQPPLVFLGCTFDFSCKGFAGGLALESVRVGPQGRDSDRLRARPCASIFRARWRRAWPSTRHRLAVHGAGLRRRAHGPGRHALRARPMVSADGGVRRRARAGITIPTSAAVNSTWSTAASTWRSPCRRPISSAPPATLTNPSRCSPRPSGPALPGRAHRRTRSRSSPPTRPVMPSEPGRPQPASSPGGSPPTASGTSRSARRPTSGGTPAATRRRWSTRSTAPRRRNGKRPTGWCGTGLQYYSEQWYPYPYPHITSIEGPIEGMEYPMITFDPRAPTREDRQWVLAHELGHQWVPMIVGSNERLYPWMDEGFNTFIDLGQRRPVFRGHAVRRQHRGPSAAPLRRPCARRDGSSP